MSYPNVTPEAIRKAYKDATKARINLTTYLRCDVDDNIHISKVCCICDRFIGPDSEAFVNINDFFDKYKMYFHQDIIDDPYNLETHVRQSLHAYYTQKHFMGTEYLWLNSMILSPRSYGSNPRDTAKIKKN